jgi:large subunit ribosomal protein L17
MRKRNSVKQLGKTYSHRKAMLNNMVTSLFMHERIVTTKQKGRELKRVSERLITRAISNLDLTDADFAKKLHNKRQVFKVIKNEDVVKKLFDEIAPRFKTRNGGYTRMYLLGPRKGDAAEMAIVELVERVPKKAKVKEEKTEEKKDKKEKKEKKEKKDKKEK